MKKLQIFSAIGILCTGLFATGFAADKETKLSQLETAQGNAQNAGALYERECGSCHLAYVPSLLPRASWEKIMAQLDKHFGDNAELDHSVRQTITDYLTRHANSGRFKFWGSQAPMRITELSYFRHEHNEIPKHIRNDPKVGSLSQCDSCHKDAKRGKFSEEGVHIPGYGRWED